MPDRQSEAGWRKARSVCVSAKRKRRRLDHQRGKCGIHLKMAKDVDIMHTHLHTSNLYIYILKPM